MEQNQNRYQYQWQVVAVLFLTWGFCGLARSSIPFLFPFFAPEFALTEAHNGYLASIVALFWALAIMTLGGLAGKIGQVKVMLPGLCFGGVALLLMSMVQSVPQLYLFAACFGYGCGAMCAPSISMVAEQVAPGQLGVCMGVMMSGYTLIGAAAGSTIATFLGDKIGWRVTYILIGLSVLLVALLMKFLLGKVPRQLSADEAGEKVRWQQLLQYKNVILAVLLTGLGMIWYFSVAAFIILYLIQVIGLTILEAGLVFTAFGCGGFLGEVSISAISDYLGRKPTIFLSISIGCCSFFLFLFGNLPLPALTACLFFSALTIYGGFPLFTSVIPSESVPKHMVAAVTAFTPAVGELVGGFAAPAIVGMAVTFFGLEMVIKAIGIIPLFSLFTAIWLTETAPKKKRNKKAV